MASRTAVDRTHRDARWSGSSGSCSRRAHTQNTRTKSRFSWDEFFQEFEERELALIYNEDGLFIKIVGRPHG